MTKAQLTSLDANSTTDEIVERLNVDGYAIVCDLINNKDTIEAIRTDLQEDIENTPFGAGDFVGQQTRRTHTVLANSRSAGLLALQPCVMSVLQKILGPFCNKFQLSSSVVISLGSGESRQEFHRDDLVYPFKHPTEQESVVTVIWALDDFTEDNGATLVIPGSHLWDDELQPNSRDAIAAVMTRGSVLILLGSVYHAGGANQTNDVRTGLLYGYCLGWLRQEQNQYLTVPPSEAKLLPKDLQELIGYTMHEPFLGWYDLQDPSVVLHNYAQGSKGAQDLVVEGESRAVQRSNITRS
ncbi:MAG: phytanoyl-CoA dioxygenase [Acidiferrobacteraceae bacterium]|nr:phytanoyl-CoA dioxygenase [Acidiferrobacteraceae bacterium]|tara:strand:+ start:2293 stop:3183 length:891 start_codon:yes stop_codon:yes gene_type:complete